MFSYVALKLWCFSDFYQRFIQGLSKIDALLTLILRTSSSIDSLTSATQIAVKNDEFDGDDSKLVEKLSKS